MQAREEVTAFLSEYHELPPAAFTPHLFSHDNEAAVRHLFRVAAGLDSIVVGEPQILGQVKDAFQAAAEHHRTGPMLSKLFHWSFLVGKRVRSETGLGEGAVSVSFAAVALARKIFGQLNWPARAGGRRGRDQHADRPTSARQRRGRDPRDQPHAGACGYAGRLGERAQRRVGRSRHRAWRLPTSSSRQPDLSDPSSRERRSKP